MRLWGHEVIDEMTLSLRLLQPLRLSIPALEFECCSVFIFYHHRGNLVSVSEHIQGVSSSSRKRNGGTRGETEADMHHRLLRSTQTGSLITSSVFESPRATRTERYPAGLVWRHHIASARLSVELIVLPYRVLLWHIFCGMILFQHTVQSDITTIMNKHCYPCVDVRGFLSALLSAPMPRWLLL